MNNIIISNPEKFKELKQKLVFGGKDNLQIISDFDRTITRAFIEGEKIPSVISLLRKFNYIDEDYSKKASELADKYHPIELDPKIPLKEKKDKMKEWWEKHFELLIKKKLNKSHIAKAVSSGKIKFRDFAGDFIILSEKKQIPFLILSSAGLGRESIEMTLLREKCFSPNLIIVSNEFIWNEEEEAIGIKKPIIHIFNKDETSLKPEIKKKLEKRENVLLIGDSLGDLGMSKGIKHKNILKIAFLNENTEENIENYKRNFDVIITGDSDFKFVLELLNEIK